MDFTTRKAIIDALYKLEKGLKSGYPFYPDDVINHLDPALEEEIEPSIVDVRTVLDKMRARATLGRDGYYKAHISSSR